MTAQPAPRLQLAQPPTIDLPPEALPPDEPAASDVIDAVCARWDVEVSELLSGSRRERVVGTRRACCVALRKRCPSLSLADIAHELRLADHATVLYHLRQAGVA